MKKKNKDAFIQKFNALDHLTRELYPSQADHGFDSLRSFSDTLQGNDGDALRFLISMRNSLAHDERCFFSVEKDSLTFLDHEIAGILNAQRNLAKEGFEAAYQKEETRIGALPFFSRFFAKRKAQSLRKKTEKSLLKAMTIADIQKEAAAGAAALEKIG
jgi:hypothetical protein